MKRFLIPMLVLILMLVAPIVQATYMTFSNDFDQIPYDLVPSDTWYDVSGDVIKNGTLSYTLPFSMGGNGDHSTWRLHTNVSMDTDDEWTFSYDFLIDADAVDGSTLFTIYNDTNRSVIRFIYSEGSIPGVTFSLGFSNYSKVVYTNDTLQIGHWFNLLLDVQPSVLPGGYPGYSAYLIDHTGGDTINFTGGYYGFIPEEQTIFTTGFETTGEADEWAENTTITLTPIWNVLSYDSFETDFGSWNDGGAACTRSSAYAHAGTWSIDLEDNAGYPNSAMYSDNLPLITNGAINVTIEFWFMMKGFSAGENFWVSYYDGSAAYIIHDYVRGSPYSDSTWYHAELYITRFDYTFSNTATFRIQSDASTTTDDVYIDQVFVNYTAAGARFERLDNTKMAPHGGSYSAGGHGFTDYAESGPLGSEVVYERTGIDITGYEDCSLSIWFSHKTNDDNENMTLSFWNDTIWDIIYFTNGSSSNIQTPWTHVTITLPDIDTVFLQFKFNGMSFTHYFDIDDLSITGYDYLTPPPDGCMVKTVNWSGMGDGWVVDDVNLSVDNNPPYFFDAYLPANGTVTSGNVTLQIHVWDAEDDPMTVIFLVFKTFMGMVNYDSQHVVTGLHNAGPFDYQASYNISVCPGQDVYWMVRISDPYSSAFYPNDTPGDDGVNVTGYAGDISTYNDYAWLIIAGSNDQPIVTYIHPLPLPVGNYDHAEWYADHALRFMVNDTEGDSFNIGISILMDNTTALSGSGDPLLSIDNQYNGTFTIDLRPYIPFDNTNYTIIIFVSDNAHCGGIYGNVFYLSFSIGSPPGAVYHFAIDNVLPADGNQHAYVYLNHGLTMNLSSTDDWTTKRNVFVFICDLKTDGGNIVGMPYGSYIQLHPPVYTGSVWISKTYGKTYLQSKHQYVAYVGVQHGSTIFGAPDAVRYVSTTEMDQLYGNSAVYIQNFSYHEGTYDNKVWKWVTEDTSGSIWFEGWRIEFWTYPVGQSPSVTENTETGWHNTNWGTTLENSGIGWLGIVLGLALVAGFSLMPFMIAKKRLVKNVPAPVQMTFTLFGFFLAFGMGLFPLWIFIPPTIILFLAIIYKTWTWITSKKQLVSSREGIE